MVAAVGRGGNDEDEVVDEAMLARSEKTGAESLGPLLVDFVRLSRPSREGR
jgi:hypothetical protein